MDFYQQIMDEGKKRAFTSTFQMVATAVPDSPYRQLLDCVHKQEAKHT